MDAMIQIAIDGPSGVGKSTAARALAEKLGFVYIDTGAMYRAIGLKAKRLGVDTADEEALANMLCNTSLTITHVNGGQRILLDGEDVEEEIRTPAASLLAAEVSKVQAVRSRMVGLQRNVAREASVVMDGRDIGTQVLPDARYKFFLTAPAQVRAKRRFDEMQKKGKGDSYEQVLADMIARDRQDSTREISPLRAADDAIHIDTGDADAGEVLSMLLSHMEGMQ